MSATTNQATMKEPVRVIAPRVMSIDIFRGLTMTVMIFVNELAGVPAMPWWTEHAPGRADYMTYVDMVFPFFLFIVGMSMPLSIAQRLRKNPSMPALWLHVVTRFIGLLVLGLFLANSENADASKMGISGSVWGLLGILSAGLYLNVYSKSERFAKLVLGLRVVGVVGVAVLLAMFRRADPGGTGWLEFGYPEILGLIAYSYLAVAAVYIPTRKWKWAPPVWFVLFGALNVLSAAKWIGGPAHWPWWFWPFSNGSMACLIMGGIITTGLFLGSGEQGNVRPSPSRAIPFALVFGCCLLAAGRIFTPLGISKIRATPTWTFYSIGASALMFALLYWICDVKRRTGWAFLFKPAGANTLTTYLLPDVWAFATAAFGFTFYDRHFGSGWPGVVRTMVFTLFILLVSAALTKAKVRLQL